MKSLIIGLLGLIGTSLKCQIYNMSNSVVSTCSGTFYDSGGGGTNYTNNQNFIMTFNPSIAGNYLQISFLTFDVQDNYDLLFVYDGNSTAAPLIGVFTGNVLPGTVTASSVNPTGSLTFKFSSNAWTNRPGWSATISCGAAGTPTYVMQNGTFTTCFANFYDTGGPNQTYNWSENSVITFCPAVAGQSISVSFGPMAIEPDDFDFLYIYDGNSTASPLIAKFANYAIAQVFTASSANPTGCLTIQFSTDADDDRAGWSATVTCGAAAPIPSYAMDATTNFSITDCGFILTDNGGANGDYMNNTLEFMKICSDDPFAPYVTMSISQFSFENNFDWLRIYDGPSNLFPLLFNGFTGTTYSPVVSASNPSGCLYIEQITDGSATFSGFTAMVTCTTIAALPIELINFSGECDNSKITLSWQTASELNNDYFNIEGSVNGTDWNSLGIVDGAGTSNTVRKYSYSITAQGSESNLFRLRQVDFDGSNTFSNIIGVNTCEISGSTTILPNPSNGKFTIRFNESENENVSVRILDTQGRLVLNNFYNMVQNSLLLDVSSFGNGSYFCEITIGKSEPEYSKLIVLSN